MSTGQGETVYQGILGQPNQDQKERIPYAETCLPRLTTYKFKHTILEELVKVYHMRLKICILHFCQRNEKSLLIT